MKPPKDDRAEFAAERDQHCKALGRNEEAFSLGLQTFVAADRNRYPYLWSWMGLPIIQMPADIVVTQEVIWSARPDVIIETGVARGGSMVFLASMLALLGGAGKVIGVDVDIRPHNRASIESHPLASRITLVEGSSIDRSVLATVRGHIPEGSKVMVILDSDHSFKHVLAELEAYAPLVTRGQYLVAADTILGYLKADQTPLERSKAYYQGDEPLAAVKAFLGNNAEFEIDPVVNGKLILSSSPNGYLRRIR